jgi:hypothetical protein
MPRAKPIRVSYGMASELIPRTCHYSDRMVYRGATFATLIVHTTPEAEKPVHSEHGG